MKRLFVSATAGLILVTSIAVPSFADQKQCEDCLRRVQAAYASCMQAKKDQVACNREQQAAAQACTNGVCKK